MTTTYEDQYVTVTEDSLTIKKYYFPHAASKTIPASSVVRVWHGSDAELGLSFFRKKTWGLALSNVWWAFAFFREFNDDKNNFVISTRDQSPFRHGFSVENPEAARVALENLVGRRQ